ncbi:hypothetical protein [Chloroflexus sp.]|uniref:hypothetical protein n=1 Tax=Chloroflexus sp. TaxID=1904827 RepID=UPI002ACD600D|nr:hypothetical protein [Chloroflexus sp.]
MERPHVAAALAEMQQAGVHFLGAVSEADDESHALTPDDLWHQQLPAIWSELLVQARHQADLRAAREAALAALRLDD